MKLTSNLIFARYALLLVACSAFAAPKPKVVILGIPETFKTSNAAMLNNLGWFTSVLNATRASTAQPTLFKALSDCFGRQQGDIKAYDPDTRLELPQIMVDWLLGNKSPQKIIEDIRKAFSTYAFESSGERDFMIKVAEIIFDPEKLAYSLGKNDDVYELVKRMHRSSNPTLILVSNFDAKTFEKLQASSSAKKLLDHFSHKYISGTSKLLVQDQKFWELVLEKNRLQPDECLVISKEPNVVAAAKARGMQTYTLNDTSKLKAHLKQIGLIH